MHNIGIVLLTILASPVVVPAQAPTRCRATSETREDLFDVFARYARDSSYAEYASALQIPLVSVSAFRIVEDSATCEAAAAAYTKACGRSDCVIGRVQVIRVSTIYIVFDPEYAYNPSVPAPLYITFDLGWRFITRIGSAGDVSSSLSGVAAGGGPIVCAEPLATLASTAPCYWIRRS